MLHIKKLMYYFKIAFLKVGKLCKRNKFENNLIHTFKERTDNMSNDEMIFFFFFYLNAPLN